MFKIFVKEREENSFSTMSIASEERIKIEIWEFKVKKCALENVFGKRLKTLEKWQPTINRHINK